MPPRVKEVPYPNWVYVRCLEQLEADAAKQPSSKMVFTYRKALASMRKYPLQLDSARDALKLEGIGPHIVEKFEAYLKKHLDNGGSQAPLPSDELRKTYTPREIAPIDIDSEDELDLPTTFMRKPPLVPSQKAKASEASSSSAASVDAPSAMTAEKMKKRARAEKEYLPRYRSGGYAALMALLECEADPELSGLPTKQELIRRAEPHSATSFMTPAAGGQYTAWSSVSTLLDKGLISKSGTPNKFALTTQGREIAFKVREAAQKLYSSGGKLPSSEEDSETEDRSDTRVPVRATSLSSGSDAELDERGNDLPHKLPPTQAIAPPQPDNSIFTYHFLDSDNNPVLTKDQAMVDFIENKLYLAIQYPIRLDSHPTSSRLVRKVKPSPGKLSLMAAFLLDDEAPDRVSKLLQDDPGKPPLLKSSASSSPSLEASSSSASSKSRPMLRRSSSSELVGASGDLVERAISMDIFVPSSSQDVSDLPPSARPRALLSTPPPTQSELDTEQMNKLMDQAQTISLKMSNCSIVLIVDNREKKDIQNSVFQEALKKKGVNCETQPLTVGDMLWIARDTVTRKEVVLGFVVERKRMDDLISSIKDNRFHEQRFRLSTCNADHVVYLVEELGGQQTDLANDLQRCQTAIWHLQVFHQMFVKVTRNFEDTIQYLTDMTTRITSMFKDETLFVLSGLPAEQVAKDVRAVRERMTHVHGKRVYVTMDLYSAINTKTKPTTIKDMFTKQLLCVKGVGRDAAVSVTEKFPTMHSLIKAYADEPNDALRQMLLADLSYGRIKRRKVGAAASQAIFQVFGAS